MVILDRLFYFGLGALGAFSFAPFSFFPVFGVIFSYLLAEVYLGHVVLKDVFKFFLGFYVANLYWVVYPLTFNLSAHFWVIPLAIVLIPGFLALCMLPAFWGLKSFKNLCTKILLFPILYTATMVILGFLFPWVLPAYIWNSHEIFMQTLSIYGVYGLSFVTMLMISLVAGAIVLRGGNRYGDRDGDRGRYGDRRDENSDFCSFICIMLAASIFLGMCIFGMSRLAENPSKYTDIKVRMVQLNVTDEEKKANRMGVLRKLIKLSYSNQENANNGGENWSENEAIEGENHEDSVKNKVEHRVVDLIIWPEAAIPYLYNEQLSRLHDIISVPLKNQNHPNSHSFSRPYLISGAIREDLKENVYNSAIFVDSSGRNFNNYDKMHLVPFGEYVPFRFLIPEKIKSIASDISDFSVGDPQFNNAPIILDIGRRRSQTASTRLRIGIVICYEAVFSRDCLKYELKNRQNQKCGRDGWQISSDENNCSADFDSGSAIDVLINLTNDGWFGFTTQPFQHLQIVRSRAVEMGVPVIRVANIGISAVFDPMGRELACIPLGTEGAAEFMIPKKLENGTKFKKLFLKLLSLF